MSRECSFQLVSVFAGFHNKAEKENQGEEAGLCPSELRHGFIHGLCGSRAGGTLGTASDVPESGPFTAPRLLGLCSSSPGHLAPGGCASPAPSALLTHSRKLPEIDPCDESNKPS